MPASENHAYDDELLVRYLLGAVPAEQAERLDELSVADEEFAWRLTGLENDLVDAFVRGELRGSQLEQFNSFYLLSPKRRQKVEFAGGLRQFQQRLADKAVLSAAPRHSSWRRIMFPGRVFQLGMATVAVAMLFISAYLVLDNARLRKQLYDARSEDVSGTQREQQLEKALAERRAADAQIQKEMEHLRGSQPNLDKLKVVSVLMLPETRGPSTDLPAVSLSPGTDLVNLVMGLELDEFPAYRATLKDPASNRVLWQSPELKSTGSAGKKAVSAAFPAGLLQGKNYIIELSGIRGGAAEPVAGYPFKVVLR